MLAVDKEHANGQKNFSLYTPGQQTPVHLISFIVFSSYLTEENGIQFIQ